MSDYDLFWIRRQIIAGISSDAELFELLILKGGNALCLIHKVGMRASIDIDYSMQNDAEDWRALGTKIHLALTNHFELHDLVLFDWKFQPRPRTATTTADRWGGYNGEFKLTTRSLFEELNADLEQVRRQALTTSAGMQSGRKFQIEISKFEFCNENEEKAVTSDTVCRVYTPDLIAAEKLRSLCQQMEEYERRQHSTPRARDFYDLYALCTEASVDFANEAFQDNLEGVFEVKAVPIQLLKQLDRYGDFHQPDWSEVLNAIPAGKPRDYEFYFDYVVQEIRKLEPLWTKHPPTPI